MHFSSGETISDNQYLKLIPIPAKGSCTTKRERTQILSSPTYETQKHSYPPSISSTCVGRLLPRAPPRTSTSSSPPRADHPPLPAELLARGQPPVPTPAGALVGERGGPGERAGDPAGEREGRSSSFPLVGVSATPIGRTDVPAKQEEPTYRSCWIFLLRARRRLSASRVRGRRKCIVCLPIPLEHVLEGQKHCTGPFCVYAYSVGDGLRLTTKSRHAFPPLPPLQ
jgi:hypothetical protein